MAQQQIAASIFDIRLRARTVALVFLAVLVPLVTVCPNAKAQTFHVLHNFTGCADGYRPTSTLLIDSSGSLYGTTLAGGSVCGDTGKGVVFRLKRSGTSWVETSLHTFTGGPGDGSTPYDYAGLIFGPDGAIYGTTYTGGASNLGTAFSLRPPATACHSALCPWSETLLYSFSLPLYAPYSGVVFDSAGNLFGTAQAAHVYELSSSGGNWTASVLSDQGGRIVADITLGPDGNLYGVNIDQGLGQGTVFQLVPSGSGWNINVLHEFMGKSDGDEPLGGLIFDSAGNLYGTTSQGGPNGGGTVFEMSPAGGGWTFNTIYALSGFTAGGPQSALTLDAAGNLYGTTQFDGQFNAGQVFKLTPSGDSWTYTDLYDFYVNNDEGIYPIGGVTLDSNGNLYGTASQSGANGAGSVWEITP